MTEAQTTVLKEKTASEYDPKEVLDQAIKLLMTGYDLDADSFFVVVTKNIAEESNQQILIGEINDSTLLAFTRHMLLHFAEVSGVDPVTYVTEHILMPFFILKKAEEKALLEQLEGESLN